VFSHSISPFHTFLQSTTNLLTGTRNAVLVSFLQLSKGSKIHVVHEADVRTPTQPERFRPNANTSSSNNLEETQSIPSNPEVIETRKQYDATQQYYDNVFQKSIDNNPAERTALERRTRIVDANRWADALTFILGAIMSLVIAHFLGLQLSHVATGSALSILSFVLFFQPTIHTMIMFSFLARILLWKCCVRPFVVACITVYLETLHTLKELRCLRMSELFSVFSTFLMLWTLMTCKGGYAWKLPYISDFLTSYEERLAQKLDVSTSLQCTYALSLIFWVLFITSWSLTYASHYVRVTRRILCDYIGLSVLLAYCVNMAAPFRTIRLIQLVPQLLCFTLSMVCLPWDGKDLRCLFSPLVEMILYPKKTMQYVAQCEQACILTQALTPTVPLAKTCFAWLSQHMCRTSTSPLQPQEPVEPTTRSDVEPTLFDALSWLSHSVRSLCQSYYVQYCRNMVLERVYTPIYTYLYSILRRVSCDSTATSRTDPTFMHVLLWLAHVCLVLCQFSQLFIYYYCTSYLHPDYQNEIFIVIFVVPLMRAIYYGLHRYRHSFFCVLREAANLRRALDYEYQHGTISGTVQPTLEEFERTVMRAEKRYLMLPQWLRDFRPYNAIVFPPSAVFKHPHKHRDPNTKSAAQPCTPSIVCADEPSCAVASENRVQNVSQQANTDEIAQIQTDIRTLGVDTSNILQMLHQQLVIATPESVQEKSQMSASWRIVTRTARITAARIISLLRSYQSLHGRLFSQNGYDLPVNLLSIDTMNPHAMFPILSQKTTFFVLFVIKMTLDMIRTTIEDTTHTVRANCIQWHLSYDSDSNGLIESVLFSLFSHTLDRPMRILFRTLGMASLLLELSLELNSHRKDKGPTRKALFFYHLLNMNDNLTQRMNLTEFDFLNKYIFNGSFCFMQVKPRDGVNRIASTHFSFIPSDRVHNLHLSEFGSALTLIKSENNTFFPLNGGTENLSVFAQKSLARLHHRCPNHILASQPVFLFMLATLRAFAKCALKKQAHFPDSLSRQIAQDVLSPMMALHAAFKHLETKTYVLTQAKRAFKEAFDILAKHAK